MKETKSLLPSAVKDGDEGEAGDINGRLTRESIFHQLAIIKLRKPTLRT